MLTSLFFMPFEVTVLNITYSLDFCLTHNSIPACEAMANVILGHWFWIPNQ